MFHLECCGDLNIPLNSVLALFCGLGFTLLVIYVLKKHDSIFKTTSQTADPTHVYCSSPNCVRCNKKNCSVLTAHHVLEEMNKNEESIPERLRSAIIDDGIWKWKLKTENSLQQPELLYIPNLSNDWWFSVKDLSSNYKFDVALLEDSYSLIKHEFCNLYTNNENDNWSSNSVPSGKWNVFYLCNQGKFLDENCQQCPKTIKLVQSMNRIIKDCIFGNVMFSVIEPGTEIKEHYGSTNARVRCHLGLIIPEGCELTVANEKKTWEQGKCLLFDDSFAHSVKFTGNNEKNVRAVLMVDVWHPSLTCQECDIISKCFKIEE